MAEKGRSSCLRIRNEFRRLTTRQIVLFLADRNSIRESATATSMRPKRPARPCWPAEKCSNHLVPDLATKGPLWLRLSRPPGRHRDLRLPVNVLVPNFTASCTWLCCERKRCRDSPAINPCCRNIPRIKYVILWVKQIRIFVNFVVVSE